MNKKDLNKKLQNKLFIVGSGRGVNRFYATNKFIEKYPNAKVINTGVLISDLAKKIDFGDLDSISIKDYCNHLEPVFIQTILNHLEHGDVILDTHFYHLMPCMSIKGLQSFIGKISVAVIILVEENPLKIYLEKRSREDSWFNSLENIKYDIFSNREYFEFYKLFFSNHISEKHFFFNPEKDDINLIETFLGEIE